MAGAKKTLWTHQMEDMEKRVRPPDRKPKRSRRVPVPGIHPIGCLCGKPHEEKKHE